MSPSSSKGKRIRVLIADDQKLFAESLQYVLAAKAEDMEIVGVATNGAEAVKLARDLAPDIILMDVRMPVLDGVEAAKAIKESRLETRIVMLSTFQNDEHVRDALAYGAVGYLVKSIAPDEVVAAIRAVNNGMVQISPSVARALSRGEEVSEPETHEEYLIEALTRREREVLALVLKSYENWQIAKFLNVTDQTAKNYIHNLYGKLGVSNRLQLLQLLHKPKIRRKLDLDADPG